MVQWLGRITISDEIAKMTLDPDNGNKLVDFTWINVKTGKETTTRIKLIDAILLAERRREDKRYRNFEFHIG